jgi:hypothetical protein
LDEPIPEELGEKLNQLMIAIPKLRYEMQQMVSELESRIKVNEQAQGAKNKETEAFLQTLQGEVTSLNAKSRPTTMTQAREKMLVDIALESNKLKEKMTAFEDKV